MEMSISPNSVIDANPALLQFARDSDHFKSILAFTGIFIMDFDRCLRPYLLENPWHKLNVFP